MNARCAMSEAADRHASDEGRAADFDTFVGAVGEEIHAAFLAGMQDGKTQVPYVALALGSDASVERQQRAFEALFDVWEQPKVEAALLKMLASKDEAVQEFLRTAAGVYADETQLEVAQARAGAR